MNPLQKKLLTLLTISAALLPATAQTISFPGAEGFGKYTLGGRGGKVFIVSNLDDNGPGSFREAVTAKVPRIVVFAVAGTIHLQSPVAIAKNVTIAGQSAPGGGICLADYPVSLSGDNIIVRYMRFRMGDRYQNKGMVDKAGADDAFGGGRRKNIVIDHCSMSWSTDEVFSIYGGDSTTVQWNILSEPLNYSYHFETGDKDFEKHGYGGIWGGSHLSAHHNLFAHCNSRNPRFNGTRLGAEQELVDFRNNVIYDWGHNNVYGGEKGNYNMVNNYYKYGPSTLTNVKNRIVNPSNDDPKLGLGRFYVTGNLVEGYPDVTANNTIGVQFNKNIPAEERPKSMVTSPFSVLPIPDETAEQALSKVMLHAGASLPLRDTLDQRILREVKDRTGKLIDVQGGYPHGTPYEKTASAWPTLKAGSPQPDADSDGMPDAWEKTNKLDPGKNDAAAFSLSKQYTNIEVYLNSLVKN